MILLYLPLNGNILFKILYFFNLIIYIYEQALGTKIINGKKECEDDEHQDLNLMFYECLHCGEIVNDVEDVVKHHESHINLRVVKVSYNKFICLM